MQILVNAGIIISLSNIIRNNTTSFFNIFFIEKLYYYFFKLCIICKVQMYNVYNIIYLIMYILS